jgi:hypothetical protein
MRLYKVSDGGEIFQDEDDCDERGKAYCGRNTSWRDAAG